MPSKSSPVPNHIRKLVLSMVKALYRLCKEYDVGLIIILDEPETVLYYTTGVAKELDGRVEELTDVLIEVQRDY